MLQRHITLLFACISALSSGTNYSFSAYGPQLASQLHLSSTALNVVSLSGNAGVYLSGPFIGVIVDRRGPRLVLSAAAACLFAGYLGLYLFYLGGSTDGLYAAFGLPGLALCQILTGIGGSAGLSSVIKATSQSFSSARRGAAMATVLSCFGLSAFFYSSVAHLDLFFSGDPTAGFLLTLAIGCGLSLLVGAAFVHPVPPPPSSTSASAPNPAAGTRAQYLAVSTSDDDNDDYTRGAFSPSSRPHSPAYPSRFNAHDDPERELRHSHSASEFSLRSDIQPFQPRRSLDEHLPVPDRPSSRRRQRSSSPLLLKDRDGDELDSEGGVHHAGELSVSGLELVRESDFWLLFCFLGLCSGVGLMFINNLGTVALTLASSSSPSGEPDPVQVGRAQAHLVSLLSVANCLGRLFVGGASDGVLHHGPKRTRFARVWWLVITAALFLASQQLALSASSIPSLALPTFLIGFAYGMTFGSVPVTCLERFGLATFATNSGVLNLSPAVFANFTNLLFGRVYDANVPPSSPSPSFSPAPAAAAASLLKRASAAAPAHLCPLGRACFAPAFKATTLMSLLAVGVALVLAGRRSFKPVYGR
ncbi:hypothetical protein JCM10207_002374 [Rhodosporidiobolus poonsookiae]